MNDHANFLQASASDAKAKPVNSDKAGNEPKRNDNPLNLLDLAQPSPWSGLNRDLDPRQYAVNPTYAEMAKTVQNYLATKDKPDGDIFPTVRAIEYSLAGANVQTLQKAVNSLDKSEQHFKRVMEAVKKDLEPLGYQVESSYANGHGTMTFTVKGRVLPNNKIEMSTDGSAHTVGTEKPGMGAGLARVLAGPDNSIRGMAMALSDNAARAKK